MAGEPNPFDDPDVSGYLDEQIERIDKLERALRGIIAHWNEFGQMMVCGSNKDDYGFDERIEAASKLVAVPKRQMKCANCGLPIGMHPVSEALQCPEFRAETR